MDLFWIPPLRVLLRGELLREERLGDGLLDGAMMPVPECQTPLISLCMDVTHRERVQFVIVVLKRLVPRCRWLSIQTVSHTNDYQYRLILLTEEAF